MTQDQWHKHMVQINFEPTQKSLTEVVEYLKCLEVLEDTDKASEDQKKGSSKAENKT